MEWICNVERSEVNTNSLAKHQAADQSTPVAAAATARTPLTVPLQSQVCYNGSVADSPRGQFIPEILLCCKYQSKNKLPSVLCLE